MAVNRNRNILMITNIFSVVYVVSASTCTGKENKHWECKDQQGCNTMNVNASAPNYKPNTTFVWKGTTCQKCGPGGSIEACSTKASCEASSSHGTQSVWWPKNEHQSLNQCKPCSQHTLHGCPQAMCPGTIKFASNTTTAAWKDGSCKKCGDSDTSGCVTQATCEGVTLSSGVPVWDTKTMRCRKCGQHDTSGCTQATCAKLKLDGGFTAGWIASENRCGKCGNGDASGCVTQATCENITLSSGVPVWDTKTMRCRKCGQDDTSGCVTQATCEAIKLSSGETVWWKTQQRCRKCWTHDQSGCNQTMCAKVKIDGANTSWIASENRCGKCGKGDTSGCITKASCEAAKISGGKGVWWAIEQRCQSCGTHNSHGCAQTDCTALKAKLGTSSGYTVNWVPSQMRCRKCGQDDSSGCVTKATCEALKISWGKAVWMPSGQCKNCGKHDTGGCSTRTDCEGIKFDNPQDKGIWKCNQKCEKCGPSDASGCPTKARCEALKMSKGNKAIWNEAEECKMCGPDAMGGCPEADCVNAAGAKVEIGKGIFSWNGQECKRCGKDDGQGCKTKADCGKASLSWGQLVWYEAKQRCVRCGRYDVGGCLDKATCESTIVSDTGKPGVWDPVHKWCSRGCSRSNLIQCVTKAACESAPGEGMELIQWNAATSKCETCSNMDASKTCRNMYACTTQTVMYQEMCCAASAKPKCAWHCAANTGQCLQWGIGATGSSATCPAKPAVTETSFAVKVAVAEAEKFDATKYQAQLAESMGVQAQNVEVVKSEFVVEVGFKFTADKAVTKAHATKAIASAWSVNETKVVVTILARRRLNEIRHLSTTDTKVTAQLMTDDPAKADSVKTSAASGAGMASVTSKLKTIANVSATVAVDKQPTMAVKITTKVRSTKTLSKPDATMMAKVATAAGGTGATVDDSSWVAEEKAGTPAEKKPKASANGADSLAVMMSFVIALAAFSLA